MFCLRRRDRGSIVSGMKALVSVIMVALLLASCGLSDAGSSSTPADGEASSEAEAAPTYTPTPEDFTIDVRVKEEECFGSAGCNVTIGIVPEYIGEANYGDDPWDVTYKIIGGSDGSTTNTMTLEGDEITFTDEEFVSTNQKGKKIEAKVTRVDPGY